ncbi:putative dsRNA-binding protein [uncultured Methanoregula sp.]|uniref:ribonuclease III family protein n=1 Tax=uncultured Methanoregula sp. TaxID=1005933 RepID=UPI002AAB4A80|nr:putative dsRNA-binding protein [uncultured Methanoregula sp.]
MIRVSGYTLTDLLHEADPDVDAIVGTFISLFNAAYGTPGADRWDITKEDWQRYEFLGDRVLSLIIAQTLFTQRQGVLDEGEMTRILNGVVSNKALDLLSRQHEKKVFTRLIPLAIGEQNTYGEKVTGGAFEAFIGALYCEVGLDDVTYFVNAIMKRALDTCNPHENVIGILQEYYQKENRPLPNYEEISRNGPEHKPLFTVRVTLADGKTFDGSGATLSDARKDAARKALDGICRNA